MAVSAPVRQLLDKVSISDAVALFARGLDRRDFHLAGSTFSSDGEFVVADGGFKGPEAIAVRLKKNERFSATTHFMGNQSVQLEGRTAKVETYVMAFHRTGSETDWVNGVRYMDDMVERDGIWRVQRRSLAMDWTRTDTITLPPPQPHPSMTSPDKSWKLPTDPVNVNSFPDDSTALSYLSERQAIRDTVTKWYNAVNEKDLEKIASCYIPETEGEYRGDWLVGLDAAMGKIKGIKNSMMFNDFLGNYLVNIQGDAASTESYFIQRSRSDRTGKLVDMVTGMRCLDTLVKRDGRWLFNKRVIGPDWSRLDPVS